MHGIWERFTFWEDIGSENGSQWFVSCFVCVFYFHRAVGKYICISGPPVLPGWLVYYIFLSLEKRRKIFYLKYPNIITYTFRLKKCPFLMCFLYSHNRNNAYQIYLIVYIPHFYLIFTLLIVHVKNCKYHVGSKINMLS